MTTPAPRPSAAAHARLLARSADFAWLLTHLHQTYGPVVEVGAGRPPRKLTYVFGPEANRFVLADGAAELRWSEALALTKFLVGDTALLVSDGEDHARRRRLVQPAFARRRLDAKLDVALDEIDTTLAGWVPGSSLDAYDQLRAMVRRVSIRTIFGPSIGARADELGATLAPALAYLNRPPAFRFDVDLRWNAYGRAIRARRATDRIILDEVARRRSGDSGPPTDGFDILGALLDGTDADDEPLSDTELCDQIRGLVAGGYDTTSSAAAWLLQLLGTHVEERRALQEQVLDTIGRARPTVEDLRSLPLVDAVVSEVLRLHPPAPVGLRIAANDVEIVGFDVPAGSMIVHSPYVSHRMEAHWDRPDAFVPARWLDAEPAPYTYVPFGGGPRKCIGFALATLELQALAVRLVQSVDWRADEAKPRSRSVANFAPTGGIPITIGGARGGAHPVAGDRPA